MKTLMSMGAVLAAAASIGACGSSSDNLRAAPSSVVDSTPTTLTSSPTTTATTPKPKPKKAREPKSRKSRPRPMWSGFGATDGAWEAAHTADSEFDPRAVYNPDPALPQVNGHIGAEYTQVVHQNGRVLGYDRHFVDLPIRLAKAQVFAHELPHDARPLWFAVKDTCAQMLAQSNVLGAALSTHAIGDPGGYVSVEFVSGVDEDHYDARAVSVAMFQLADKTSPSGAGDC